MRRDDMESLTKFEFLVEETYRIAKESKPSAEKLRSMAGEYGEWFVANYIGGAVVSKSHFDVIALEDIKLSSKVTIKTGDRIEVKTPVQRTAGYTAAYSLQSKIGKCEFIALFDMTGDEPRLSIIPEEVFFVEGEFTSSKGKDKDRFYWSAKYDISLDTKLARNAMLFIDYEVEI